MKLLNLRINPKKSGLSIQKLSQAFKKYQYKAKTAWGLDIGGYALKAVKIIQKSGVFEVEDFDIIEYTGLPFNVSLLQSDCIKEAIQTFLTRHRITKNDKIVVSIPGQYVLSRFIGVPSVNKKQIKDIVNYEVKQQIPFDFKDIIWDYQQLSDLVPGTDSVDIGLFASKRATLDHILTNISPVKSLLTALQISPLAISNFVFFDHQLDGPTIIINSETENTDLMITDGLHLWIRSIPLSTIDINLVKEIHRSMEYYKSLTKETVNFKTLLLMGNRFTDPLNVKFINDNFTYNVRVLNTLNNLELSNKVNPAYFKENLLNLGVALGLALQGIKVGRVKVNLMPPELIKAAEISKKKFYAVATLSCLAISLIIQYGGLYFHTIHLDSLNDYHQKILQNIKELERKYKNAETLAQTNKYGLDQVSSIDVSRFFWMDVLDKLLFTIPDNVSITSIQTSWINADAIKTENQIKKTAKPDIPKKLLLMGIKGESKEPSMSFIEEHIVKPIQNLTLFDQKVPAVKNVEIVPGSCKQIKHKDELEGYISFEIRWIVKSQDEIQSEIEALPLVPGTSTSLAKS